MGDVITQIFKFVKISASTVKNSSSEAKRVAFAALSIVAIVASLSHSGTRIAYKVNYGGHTIATVSSKKTFNEALKLVVSRVDGNGVEDVVEKPEFNTTVVLSDNINNTEEVADAIIDCTDEIVKATTLVIDGNDAVCAEKDMIYGIVNARLNGFNVDGQECTSRFVNTVEYEDGYFLASDIDGRASVEEIVNSLSVVTEMHQVSDIIVPYKSTVKTTNEQMVGYSMVSVSGVSGVNRVTQDVVMLNGEVQSCVDVNTEVVVAPVDEVVVKGTAKTLASAQQKQTAHSAGFIFPVPDGSWRISSYYGDGRNHKGVDLCAKSGTSIFAVADGKVVYSGWKGAYGNCVIIEHSNGMRTLYGHAKQLCCSVGDMVSQGEVIALVGTTGQSSGNHVHFEVILNGKNVDPAPYIGLD